MWDFTPASTFDLAIVMSALTLDLAIVTSELILDSVMVTSMLMLDLATVMSISMLDLSPKSVSGSVASILALSYSERDDGCGM